MYNSVRILYGALLLELNRWKNTRLIDTLRATYAMYCIDGVKSKLKLV